MQKDIWKFSGLLLFAGIFGYSLGHTVLSMLVTSIGIIAWQIYRLKLLNDWVDNPKQNPMPDVSGQLYNLYRSINRNESKTSKRKQQLSSYLTQFRKAVRALPDAIILVNDDGKIEWANKNAYKTLGIRWPKDNNVRFSDLIRYPEVNALLEQANSKKHPPEQGVLVNSIYNNEQTINFKCVRYTEELRMVIARDVSRLLRVNQMHSDFIANVSHELKTPLTVLKGYIEILADNPELPSKLNKPLTQMSIQSTRMELIVGGLLYLAKLEDTDNIEPHRPIDVSNLIKSVIESVGSLAEEKNHTLKVEIEDSITITGAQAEIHSAFSNLITNAIHYTPENGEINVQWKNDVNGPAFSVTDNGSGIAPRHIERLTQRFYRVDSDRSREGGGTGLGLAIVKHVLQRHGAELEISSEEGQGSIFKCVFLKKQNK